MRFHEDLVRFLNVHGIGIRNLIRLNRAYGKDALSKLRENPYRVIDECDGFGFKTADKIAFSIGFQADDPRRLYALLVSLCMVSPMMMEARPMTMAPVPILTSAYPCDCVTSAPDNATRPLEMTRPRIFVVSVFTPRERTMDNFWEIGEGPGGPDTEIYYDRGEKYDPRHLGEKLFFEDIENDRYIEVWNVVFSQYDCKPGIVPRT